MLPHYVFSQQPLHNSLIRTFRDVVSFKKQRRKQSNDQMVNCSSVLKASSELTDCPCRFCSAKKRERDQPSSAATEQIQLSSDLKFSLSILGLGHSVSVSPCIFAGDASTGGVHLRAIGPLSLFEHLCSLLLQGLTFELFPWFTLALLSLIAQILQAKLGWVGFF